MHISKPYQLKAPPRLDALFPLLLSYPIDIRKSKAVDPTKILHIDFSAVESFDALGLTIFIANLAKEVRKHEAFEYQITYPAKENTAKILAPLRISDLLQRLGLRQRRGDLWDEDELKAAAGQPHYQEFDKGRQAILYVSSKHKAGDRESLQFSRKCLKRFYEKNPCKSINYSQIHHILDEIIKNTVDHANDDGITALKFEGNSNSGILKFSHSELGDGISLNVRRYLESSEEIEYQRLGARGSTADFLHWAFLPGHTSKPDSGVNAGLGLSHIHSAAKGGKVDVYFSDAQSIAYVTDFPEQHSHKQLRKKLYHSHPLPCFMYFGETKKYE